MISMQKGDYPKFTITGKDLPFSDADVGKRFKITGTVKIDAILPEGPAFNFELLEIDFPEKTGSEADSRKKKRNLAAAGITITIG